jgi:hypothetical protein
MADENPWDAALGLDVVRGNHAYSPGPLEPGVKFFVLELEKRRCRTVWSCEGHPHGFHVMFRGPLVVARAIVLCSVFDVGLAPPYVVNGTNGYDVNLSSWENRAAYWPGRKPWDDEQRVSFLREAAAAWVDKLDSTIRDLREEATPAAKAARRAIALCDDCTDPSGCRAMGYCWQELDEYLNEEERAPD